MCELCDGTFEQIATLEVSRAAWALQHTNTFGALYVVAENCNVETQHIKFAMLHEAATEWDLHVCWLLLGLDEDERISALALSQNLWGAEPIRHGRR